MSATTRPMFEIYVDDDRYAVPTLHLVSANDESAARHVVDLLLSENPHHLGAELYFEGRLICGVGSFALTPRLSTARGDPEPRATA
jgi:hypothetical protein